MTHLAAGERKLLCSSHHFTPRTCMLRDNGHSDECCNAAVCLTRPPKLVLHPPPVSKSDIKPIPGLGHCCRKTTKKQTPKGTVPSVWSRPFGYKGPGVGPVSRAESVGRLIQCGHQYHLHCLVAMYNNGNKDSSLQCPTYKTIYSVKTGNQPACKMEYHIIPHSLPGHPDRKTIRIIYNTIQGPEHPNPGKPYTARGFPRHCYLPDSKKGRKLLSYWCGVVVLTV